MASSNSVNHKSNFVFLENSGKEYVKILDQEKIIEKK